MSSFKRKTPSKQVVLPPGTRTCPTSTSTILASSGIPSLDDILGGGVPLSCSLAILAPDPHSAYGELVQKYFIAQGIANNHKVCVIHEDALSFVKECMWIPAMNSGRQTSPVDDDSIRSGDKIRIAWRYEQMKKFETTVTNLSADYFCGTFDLTCRIPMSVIDAACDAEQLTLLNLTMDNNDISSSIPLLLKRIKHILEGAPFSEVVRLCIADLGSPAWGRNGPVDISRFLYALRRLLRRYPSACACVSIAPPFCTSQWEWTQKVSWLTDATISMSGFGANPALTALFPSHHGLVQVHKLPAPHSVLPTSDKHSVLRGLSSSAAANVGTGENNLAFKCTRKRLIFETMHLDLEGGVAERRTTPAIGSDVSPVHTHVSDKGNTAEFAGVAVELEATCADMKSQTWEGNVSCQNAESGRISAIPPRVKKVKRVAFQSDKPDLYDF